MAPPIVRLRVWCCSEIRCSKKTTRQEARGTAHTTRHEGRGTSQTTTHEGRDTAHITRHEAPQHQRHKGRGTAHTTRHKGRGTARTTRHDKCQPENCDRLEGMEPLVLSSIDATPLPMVSKFPLNRSISARFRSSATRVECLWRPIAIRVLMSAHQKSEYHWLVIQQNSQCGYRFTHGFIMYNRIVTHTPYILRVVYQQAM